MNKEFEEVRAFHQAFGHPISNVPVSLTEDRAKKICLDFGRNK